MGKASGLHRNSRMTEGSSRGPGTRATHASEVRAYSGCAFPAGFRVGQSSGRPFLGGRWRGGCPRPCPPPNPRRPGGAQRGRSSRATLVSAAPVLGPTVSLSWVRCIPLILALRHCHSPRLACCPCLVSALKVASLLSQPRLRMGSWVQLVDSGDFSGVA